MDTQGAVRTLRHPKQAPEHESAISRFAMQSTAGITAQGAHFIVQTKQPLMEENLASFTLHTAIGK